MSHSSLSTYSTPRIWQQPVVTQIFIIALTAVYILWLPEAWAITEGDLSKQITQVHSTVKNLIRPALYGVCAFTFMVSIIKQSPVGGGVAVIGLLATKMLGDWVETNYALII